MKRNIIFVPTYYYLSHTLFFSISEKLSNYKKVYFNTKERNQWIFNKKEIKKDEVLSYFDYYCEINNERDYKNSKFRILQKIFEYKRYINNIKNILNEIKPIAIITTSDMSYSARICNQWASKNNIPVIIIQPSFLNFKMTDYNLKKRVKYLLFNKILNIPFYRKQVCFGNENKNNYLFLFWGGGGSTLKNIIKGSSYTITST